MKSISWHVYVGAEMENKNFQNSLSVFEIVEQIEKNEGKKIPRAPKDWPVTLLGNTIQTLNLDFKNYLWIF